MGQRPRIFGVKRADAMKLVGAGLDKALVEEFVTAHAKTESPESEKPYSNAANLRKVITGIMTKGEAFVRKLKKGEGLTVKLALIFLINKATSGKEDTVETGMDKWNSGGCTCEIADGISDNPGLTKHEAYEKQTVRLLYGLAGGREFFHDKRDDDDTNDWNALSYMTHEEIGTVLLVLKEIAASKKKMRTLDPAESFVGDALLDLIKALETIHDKGPEYKLICWQS